MSLFNNRKKSLMIAVGIAMVLVLAFSMICVHADDGRSTSFVHADDGRSTSFVHADDGCSTSFVHADDGRTASGVSGSTNSGSGSLDVADGTAGREDSAQMQSFSDIRVADDEGGATANDKGGATANDEDSSAGDAGNAVEAEESGNAGETAESKDAGEAESSSDDETAAEGDVDTVELDDMEVPLAGGIWALVNMVLCALTMIGAVGELFVGQINRRDYEDEGSNRKLSQSALDDIAVRRRRMTAAKIAGLLTAAASGITFYLTEDIDLPMALIDRYTPLMLIIFAVQIASATLNIKSSKLEADVNKEASEGTD